LTPQTGALRIERTITPVETYNVLGFLEGTDKKDEIVVVTSHYDHVGVNDGKIYNGADDDGSGTVSVLKYLRLSEKLPKLVTVLVVVCCL
jgi:Zn-dependent M28 family amino/carboxypeptidase